MQAKRLHKPSSLTLSLVFGIICALCMFLYLTNIANAATEARNETLAAYGGDQIDVCVAVKDIPAGTEISASDVQVKKWIVELLPSNPVRNINDILGMRTNESIIAGEVISEDRFNSTTHELEIPAGYSAVSVPAKEVQAVGGAITPGMNVAMYATGDMGTVLIGENLEVLETNASNSSSVTSSSTTQTSSNNNQSISWITLAIPFEQVETVVAAAQKSQLYFVIPGASVALDTGGDTLGNNSKQ